MDEEKDQIKGKETSGKITTIRVHESTPKLIRTFEKHPREAVEDIILRMYHFIVKTKESTKKIKKEESKD